MGLAYRYIPVVKELLVLIKVRVRVTVRVDSTNILTQK